MHVMVQEDVIKTFKTDAQINYDYVLESAGVKTVFSYIINNIVGYYSNYKKQLGVGLLLINVDQGVVRCLKMTKDP